MQSAQCASMINQFYEHLPYPISFQARIAVRANLTAPAWSLVIGLPVGRAVKEILEPSPVGELRCSKDQLDQHLQTTYGDPERGKALGVLAGLPDFAPEPEVAFNMKPISWKEHQSVVGGVLEVGGGSEAWWVVAGCLVWRLVLGFVSVLWVWSGSMFHVLNL
eukprot:sb/3472654/